MTKNLDKDGFCSIVDNYQLFYIDLWGVIHNGINLHKEAIKVLKEISKKGKEYILLTNAPRPNSTVKIILEKSALLLPIFFTSPLRMVLPDTSFSSVISPIKTRCADKDLIRFCIKFIPSCANSFSVILLKSTFD